MSDYIMIVLLTLAVYYPLTLGALAGMMYIAWRRRRSPLLAVGVGAVDAAVRAVRQGGV